MIVRLKSRSELLPFFTNELLENGCGVVIENDIPDDSHVAIDIDEYYHKNVTPTPEIADLLLVAQRLSDKKQHHIYIIEMKNIDSPRYFKVQNIYDKFHTAIEDFMKNRYADVFLDDEINVTKFRLLFITDAYRLKKEAFPAMKYDRFFWGQR
jgi:hypothetical protein